MTVVWTLIGLTAAIIFYAVALRPWLRRQEFAKGYFAHPFVEWCELNLFSKSESILWARWQQFLGITLTLLGFLGAIDWSLLAAVLPPQYVPFLPLIPMVLNLTGSIAEALRRDTTAPLAVVALPEVKPPQVAIAVAEVAAVNELAVATVEAAVKKGEV